MSYYDDIYEYASDNYGLFTTADANNIGIPIIELAKLAQRGRLKRIGHGVYRIAHYIPTPLDKYADAVALVGHEAYIYGESVLAMHGLANVNPLNIYVACTQNVRKKVPPYIKIIRETDNSESKYEGITTQNLADAIITCKASVMTERLEDATKEALRLGLISKTDATAIAKELNT